MADLYLQCVVIPERPGYHPQFIVGEPGITDQFGFRRRNKVLVQGVVGVTVEFNTRPEAFRKGVEAIVSELGTQVTLDDIAARLEQRGYSTHVIPAMYHLSGQPRKAGN
ncbi:hypothetical protein HYU18_00550 [Candidatus Woesearchaeota archaeon]|nr:hypothetical protein [Candidatus Woesearchaeota archaeon]